MRDAEGRAAEAAIVAEHNEDERREDADPEQDEGASSEEQRCRPAQLRARPPQARPEEPDRDDEGRGRDDREEEQQQARLLADPGRVGVVDHHQDHEPAERDERLREHPGGRDHPAREDGHDLGHDPEHRHERDVRERLAEQPDEFRLHRVSVEEEVERTGELSLEQDEGESDRCDGDERDREPRPDVDRPREHRRARPLHPIGAQRPDRGDEIRGRAEQRDCEKQQADQPEVDSVALLRERERWEPCPPGLGRATARERGEHDGRTGEDEEPEGGRGDLGLCCAGGSDHQRHEVGRKARHDRDEDEEDEQRPVHRQHSLIRPVPEDRRVRPRDLQSHQQRQDPGDHEEDAGHSEVERADPLVIKRDQPACDATAVPRSDGRSAGAH